MPDSREGIDVLARELDAGVVTGEGEIVSGLEIRPRYVHCGQFPTCPEAHLRAPVRDEGE